MARLPVLYNYNDELEAKNKELRLKNEQLKEITENLRISSARLESKTQQLDQANESILQLTHDLAQVNEELAAMNREISLAYEEIKSQSKIQGDFINIAAHELRTTITPILGIAEILREQQPDEKIKKEYIESIVRNAERLERTANNILDVTRIENNSLKLNKERVLLNDIVLEVVEDTKKQTIKKKLKIIYEPTQKDIIVEVDPFRLSQVISNLLSNSIKFTHEGGLISVSVQEEDKEWVVVTIKDSGSGVDPEILPRLFFKFAMKSDQGMGLGLFISKSIIQAHGGKIWAENNCNGEMGAIFKFTLPLYNNHDK